MPPPQSHYLPPAAPVGDREVNKNGVPARGVFIHGRPAISPRNVRTALPSDPNDDSAEEAARRTALRLTGSEDGNVEDPGQIAAWAAHLAARAKPYAAPDAKRQQQAGNQIRGARWAQDAAMGAAASLLPHPAAGLTAAAVKSPAFHGIPRASGPDGAPPGPERAPEAGEDQYHRPGGIDGFLPPGVARPGSVAWTRGSLRQVLQPGDPQHVMVRLPARTQSGQRSLPALRDSTTTRTTHGV